MLYPAESITEFTATKTDKQSSKIILGNVKFIQWLLIVQNGHGEVLRLAY
jgi:hypothetical protein